jgi:transcriptional regulator with PAS, ATPase and Fis domain
MSSQPDSWMKGFPGSIFVCDTEGILLEMNDRAAESVKEDGGWALIGKNILDCHPEPAKSKMKDMLRTHEPNIYTIEKKGVKKLIYQTPFFKDGSFAGFVELSLVIPFEMPHFVRE